MSARVCVVNVANGAWFPKGQERLKKSLEAYPGVAFKGWSGEYPPKCLPHAERPYEFKRTAIAWARDQGFDIAIWADASCWFVRDPKYLVRAVEDRGYWFCTLGWNIGQWCSDAALPATGHSREELLTWEMIAATFYALDLRKSLAGQYNDYMASKQPYFPGPYTNVNGEASADRSVGGHRHDQTFLSVFVREHNLIVDRPPCFFNYALQARPGDASSAIPPDGVAVAIAQGM